ncbi:MAG: septum formation initiator family protein [Schleiferiaceae bacterium]
MTSIHMVKKIKNNIWVKRFTNKFVLATGFFVVWMVFIDDNSWLVLGELNSEIESLENGIEYYSKELEINRKELNELESNPASLEKFAREKYWMVKPGEEIFLIDVE